MIRTLLFSGRTTMTKRLLTLAVLYSCISMSSATAALVHQYTFNGSDVVDSVGSADGTLVGTASISGGRLILTGGGAGESYANLPNGIATGAANGGTAGALSFEVWAQAAANADWAGLVSLGGADGHEDDNDGPQKDYIQLIPRNGQTGVIRATTHAIGNGTEGFVDHSSALSETTQQHMVVVVDQSGGLPGTIDLYVDGAHVNQAAIATGMDVSTMVDNNNWLGRSQWGDSSFNGSYNEFRIYDHALDAQEVADSYAAGPIPEPASLSLIAAAGMFVLAGRRRQAIAA